MPSTLPAFFIEGPKSPEGAPENIAVNIVKCSGICRSGVRIKKSAFRRFGRFAVIYFRGCSVTWFFADNSQRDAWFNKLLKNEWSELESYNPKRNAKDPR